MEKIFKRLDFVISTTEQISLYFDKSELEEVSMFCLCMLDRLNCASEGLTVLLNKFTVNTKVEYSSGIIIRASLLDYLIVLNAMELYGKNLDNVEKLHVDLKEYCLMMLCDSVRHTMKYFDSLEGQIPKEILSNMYNNLVLMNQNCFETYMYDGSRPKIKIEKYKSSEKLFNTLMHSEDLQSYKSVYEAYLYYSKYDHFGHMFYGLSRIRPLDQLSNIDKAIKTFPIALLFIVLILKTFNWNVSFLEDKLNEIQTFIDENEK